MPHSKKLTKEIDKWIISATTFLVKHQKEGNSVDYQRGYIQALAEVKEELRRKRGKC